MLYLSINNIDLPFGLCEDARERLLTQRVEENSVSMRAVS